MTFTKHLWRVLTLSLYRSVNGWCRHVGKTFVLFFFFSVSSFSLHNLISGEICSWVQIRSRYGSDDVIRSIHLLIGLHLQIHFNRSPANKTSTCRHILVAVTNSDSWKKLMLSSKLSDWSSPTLVKMWWTYVWTFVNFYENCKCYCKKVTL